MGSRKRFERFGHNSSQRGWGGKEGSWVIMKPISSFRLISSYPLPSAKHSISSTETHRKWPLTRMFYLLRYVTIRFTRVTTTL